MRTLVIGGFVALAPISALGAQVVACPDTTEFRVLRIKDDSSVKAQISGRLQTQFYAFDNEAHAAEAGSSSNFFIRRARIQANVRVHSNVCFVIQPSFEGGRSTGVRLRDAFIDVRLTPASSKTNFTVRMGAEKKPFNRYELLSSNNLPSLERNAGRGLVPVASNNLFEAGGYIATDLGASLILSRQLDDHRKLWIQAGGYNGQGESVHDVNGSKSFGLRATIDLTRKLGIGASFFSHDGIVEISPTVMDSSFRNDGFGLEAQWGRPGDAGLFVVADYMAGENFSAARRSMRGLSVVAAFNARLGSGAKLFALEPVARLDLADPDADTDRNGSSLVSAGVNLYVTPKAQLRMLFERQAFRAPGQETIAGVRSAMTLNF